MIGRADAMAVGGIVNTAGNFGGIIAVPIVAYLSGRHAWGEAFVVGSICALTSAMIWFGIDVEEGAAEARSADQLRTTTSTGPRRSSTTRPTASP